MRSSLRLGLRKGCDNTNDLFSIGIEGLLHGWRWAVNYMEFDGIVFRDCIVFQRDLISTVTLYVQVVYWALCTSLNAVHVYHTPDVYSVFVLTSGPSHGPCLLLFILIF